MRNRKDCYVMVDVEASGSRYGFHDLIQFGATAAWGEHLESREAFPEYRARPELPLNLVAPQFGGEPDPQALAVTGLDWEQIREFGELPVQWAARFHDWVGRLKRCSGAELVILVGHGITMDWAMIKLLYDTHRTDWPCHYSGMDFKSWWGGMRSREHIDASQTDMAEVFGVQRVSRKHDAQADADYQMDMMLKAFAKVDIIATPAGDNSQRS